MTLAKASGDDPIALVASRLEPALRRAFLAAVARLRDSVSIGELAAAIQSGDVTRVMAILALDQRFADALNGVGVEPGEQSFRDAVQAAYVAGAAEALVQLPSRLGIAMSFNLMNPESTAFLERYTFSMIREISTQTADAVRAVVLRAFREGGHPFEQARTIKTFIGLTDRQARAVENYRRTLSSASTLKQSLRRALRDGRFDRSVARAARGNVGMDPQLVDRMVQRYRERYLQYRAQTVARTESLRASNKGQRALWKQAVEQGLIDARIRRRWVVSGDSATCDECSDLDGTTAGLDEAFPDGTFEPPHHPDCRCSTVLEIAPARSAAA